MTAGETRPLVLVHGFLGGAAQWDGLVGDLAGRHCAALDLPGFGAAAAAQSPASIRGFAEDALSQLDRLGIGAVDLLGHSMGGMIVQEMAALAPGRVRRLVLYATGAVGVLPGRFETIDESKRRARADGPRATARRIAATWFLEREAAAAYEPCAQIAEQCAPQAIEAGLEAMRTWSGADRLKDIAAPTLIIWGDGDRSYPWAQIERLWRGVPQARLAVIPGCAHAAHLEKPALFAAILRDALPPEPR